MSVGCYPFSFLETTLSMDTQSFARLQDTLSSRYLKAFVDVCRLHAGRAQLGCPWLNFNTLVDTYYTSLYQFAYSLAHNKHEAADLVQQTFYIYARKGGGLRQPDKIKTWLFTTLYREFLSMYRKGSRLIAHEPQYLEEVVSVPLNPNMMKSLDGGIAVQALKQVDEIYRVPLVLYFLQEYSYRDIAKILDIPMGTVMSRLSRGKKQLKAYFLRKKADRI